MKYLSLIVLMGLMAGCATTSDKAEVKATSSEQELINTLTANGCSIDKYHRMAKMGAVDVECK